jgi:uncharacterized protein YdhG (YjbR/CyaY superfamily)
MKSAKSIKDTDSYLALQPEKVRGVLEKLRQTIKSSAPEAEEVISYGMPAFRYHGILVYFAAFKNHCSLFPGSIVEKMKNELKDFKTSKGTIQFTAEKPLPAALVKKIVKARVKENLNKKKILSTKKTK